MKKDRWDDWLVRLCARFILLFKRKKPFVKDFSVDPAKHDRETRKCLDKIIERLSALEDRLVSGSIPDHITYKHLSGFREGLLFAINTFVEKNNTKNEENIDED